jgi:hypothetical protein
MILRKVFLGFCSWFLFLVILIPLSLPLFLLFLYRVFVIAILRRLFRKDLVGPIMNPDFGFAADAFWDNPRSGIAFVYVIDGPLKMDDVCARLSAEISLSETKAADVPNYERLTSVYPSYWFGYPFWTKAIQKFDVRDHVRIGAQKQDEIMIDVNRILRDWLVSPFMRNRPLWDVLIISGKIMNYSSVQITILMTRF